jgi:pimeloyl-ACP methyl ester carboxylesterase
MFVSLFGDEKKPSANNSNPPIARYPPRRVDVTSAPEAKMSEKAPPSAFRPEIPPRANGLRRPFTGLAERFRLPDGLQSPRYASIRYWDRSSSPVASSSRRAELAPVVLVHGYGGTHIMWTPLREALESVGFDCLIALRYNASRMGIEAVADLLVDRAKRAMAATGINRVHLVGHSLGGLVVREAVQRRGLAGLTSTAVTIAAPHAGARLARFVPGPAARQMCPGSAFLKQLDQLPVDRSTHWVAIQGRSDRVVPHYSTAFDAASPATVTIRQSNGGHRSIARHPHVVSFIVEQLLHTESPVREAFSLAA